MVRTGRAGFAAFIVFVAASGAGAQQPERGAFVLLRGSDTLAVERFEWRPGSLESTLVVRPQDVRIHSRTELLPDWTATRISMEAGRASAPDTAPPMQKATIAFSGDTAVVTQAGLPAPIRLAVAAGSLPFVNLTGSSLELVARRAAAAHLDTVPVLVNTTPLRVVVTRLGPDSLVLGFGSAEFRVQVDGAGHVLGGTVPSQNLRLVRAADARLGAGPPPDYSAPPGAPYTAEEVTLLGPAGPLAGTLTLPKSRAGRVPAVVTITGSGLEDRDESLGFIAPGYRPFRQVADTLGRRGIAVLRLDDRGWGKSGGDASRATSEDFASDVEAGVRYLRARPEIAPDRIALVGHSEGGIIAPLVALADPRVRAIVLMAGPAYTGRKVLRYQLGNLFRDSTLKGAASDSAVERQVERFGATNAWTRFFLDYDPLGTARKVRVPVLILQGEVDRQVTAEQAPLLGEAFRKGGDRDVTVHVFPGRNHLFLRDATGDPQNYPRLSSYTIDSEVMGTLADWLVAHLGAPRETRPASRE